MIRDVLARERPVAIAGRHYQLPFDGGTGLGKPLTSTVHPLRSDIPILLGAEGPKNAALAAEIADGWLPLFFAPRTTPSTARAWPWASPAPANVARRTTSRS